MIELKDAIKEAFPKKSYFIFDSDGEIGLPEKTRFHFKVVNLPGLMPKNSYQTLAAWVKYSEVDDGEGIYVTEIRLASCMSSMNGPKVKHKASDNDVLGLTPDEFDTILEEGIIVIDGYQKGYVHNRILYNEELIKKYYVVQES